MASLGTFFFILIGIGRSEVTFFVIMAETFLKPEFRFIGPNGFCLHKNVIFAPLKYARTKRRLEYKEPLLKAL